MFKVICKLWIEWNINDVHISVEHGFGQCVEI